MFNCFKNACKANVLPLLLSSLVTNKLLQDNIDIATEQSFMYTDEKIWHSKNVSTCQVFAEWVTNKLSYIYFTIYYPITKQ